MFKIAKIIEFEIGDENKFLKRAIYSVPKSIVFNVPSIYVIIKLYKIVSIITNAIFFKVNSFFKFLSNSIIPNIIDEAIIIIDLNIFLIKICDIFSQASFASM